MMTLSEASRAELVMLREHVQVHGPRGLPVPSLLREVRVWSDAGAVGYGGHMAGEEKEHHAALPADLIGSSSTRRELYAHRKVAMRLGENLRGKKVLFLMDSRAGVQNMLNQGGSIRELNQSYREWLQVCTDLDIEPYFEWIPREENTRADKLSKRVPLLWRLGVAAAATMATAFPGVAWTLPDLNQYGNVLAQAQRAGGDLLLVHPVWLAAAWWNVITTYGIKKVELQTADKALECIAKARPGPGFWKMQATLLRFGSQP